MPTTVPSRPVYIYALRDPQTRCIRYIGVALDPRRRLNDHLAPSALKTKTRKNSWLKNVLMRGLKPIMTILGMTDAEHRGAEEIAWIAAYRSAGYDLTNGTDGGDGCLGRTHVVSPEARAKISAAMMGISPSTKGKAHTPEARAKMSVSARHRPPNLKKTPKSPEHRAKLSASRMGIGKGIPLSAEHREKIATAQKGKPKTTEHRAKLSANKREWYARLRADNRS